MLASRSGSVCAQRLSASLESSRCRAPRSAPSARRAQRLSASLESSLFSDDVLIDTAFEVLNAFRHHWNLHGLNTARGCSFVLCSTPFGIIGIFTIFAGVISIFARLVLNAFRHHWNLH